jgi:hypothetical protein
MSVCIYKNKEGQELIVEYDVCHSNDWYKNQRLNIRVFDNNYKPYKPTKIEDKEIFELVIRYYNQEHPIDEKLLKR